MENEDDDKHRHKMKIKMDNDINGRSGWNKVMKIEDD